MYCVKSRHSLEEIIKKSRFIGIIMPCADEREVQAHLRQLAIDYSDASHIAHAYRIKTEQGLIYRFHDAGEPTGTAGKPIFLQLEGKQLINTLIAVIRYYGGVKLGAGGLTGAYGNAAKNIIQTAELEAYIGWVTLPLVLDYKELQALEYLLNKLGGRITQQNFSEQVKLAVQLPADQAEILQQSFPSAY